MHHAVSENSFTVDVHPLSKYRKTFFRAQKKAFEKGQILIVDPSKRPMDMLTEPDLTAFSVAIFRQGAFTTALVIWMEQPVCVGVCKRNQLDKDAPARGEHLAVRRAIHNLFADDLKELSSEKFDPLVILDEPDVMDADGVFEVERVAPGTITVIDDFGMEDLDRIKKFAEEAKPDTLSHDDYFARYMAAKSTREDEDDC